MGSNAWIGSVLYCGREHAKRSEFILIQGYDSPRSAPERRYRS